jgi:5-methylcytosine-specific restriction endonuclease McrA
MRGGPTTDVSLHVHHVRPVEEGGGHTLANLATLCEECHTRYHGED